MNEEGVTVRRGRGRPRPDDVIERDESVYALLHRFDTPTTSADIAHELDCTPNRAYLSLCRLRAQGRARRHNNAWIALAR